MSAQLDKHFFRHQFGKLVAMLSGRVGLNYIQDVEDAVQSALMAALEKWTVEGVPEQPSAWLFKVAQNNLIAELRKRARRRRILEENGDENVFTRIVDPASVPDGEQDDMLRMMFVCCDENIPVESQLVFALRSLCGFDVREIAIRLFISEANVYKRLGRARKRLQGLDSCAMNLPQEEYALRLPVVQKVLYVLFTEGYLSSNSETAIRRELCHEAIRLTTLLAENAKCQTPETFALLALQHLHLARMSSRQDASGGLLLLEEQDRALWDQSEIGIGLGWLARSSEGEMFSRYHAEAGIAAEHCLAPSFKETRWDRVAECYSLLEHFTLSPIHKLNRAVAVAEWKGPKQGLEVLDGFEPPTWLAGSYQWAAVLADLNRRSGNSETANRYFRVACQSAPTEAVKELIKRRLQLIELA